MEWPKAKTLTMMNAYEGVENRTHSLLVGIHNEREFSSFL
jgi:hypothetical protein